MKKCYKYGVYLAFISMGILMKSNAVYAHVSDASLSPTALSETIAPELVEKSVFQNNTNSKVISNVRVFPNPTSESISLSFKMNKRANVSIKVMDALGSEMLTLMNQVLDAGIQNHTFDIQKKLPSGVYFIRITSSGETIVKRISVVN